MYCLLSRRFANFSVFLISYIILIPFNLFISLKDIRQKIASEKALHSSIVKNEHIFCLDLGQRQLHFCLEKGLFQNGMIWKALFAIV